jgi:hypothetical protein
MENIENKIDYITDLTDSQKDRGNLKEIMTNDLVDFLHTFVRQVMAKNTLEDEIDTVLKERINPLHLDGEEEPERLTNYELLKLKEIISREKTDSKGNLIKAIIEASKNLNEASKNKESEGKSNSAHENITQEDINEAKKVTELLSKVEKFLEKTEFSEEEKEKKE